MLTTKGSVHYPGTTYRLTTAGKTINAKIDPKGKAIAAPTKRKLRPKLNMLEEDDSSGSDGTLGSSPSSQSMMAEGSDLFKKLLDDYILEEGRVSKAEMDRYRTAKSKRTVDDDYSSRCDRCQSVMTLCKCDLYGSSREREFGHRVHWADEVWDKPLTTDMDYDFTLPLTVTETDVKRARKPILKHRATCIIIVSE